MGILPGRPGLPLFGRLARGKIIADFDLVEAGKLKVLIDQKFPLEQGMEAVRVIDDRSVFGKVVVTP